MTASSVFEGNFKEPCDIIHPSVLVEYNAGMINANYCYIPDFGRYYFIDKQIMVSYNLKRLELTVDPLESFATQIKAMPCIIDNSANDNEKYLNNPLWVSKVKTKTDILTFPNGLNDNGEFILITAGG